MMIDTNNHDVNRLSSEVGFGTQKSQDDPIFTAGGLFPPIDQARRQYDPITMNMMMTKMNLQIM